METFRKHQIGPGYLIPRDYITEWRAQAPWVQDFQVEQDLVISRALVAIFRHPYLRETLALRGGTALYKIHIQPPIRYSEDIDLVQVRADSAGPMMSAIREVFNPWMQKPSWKQTKGRVTFVYRFRSENKPSIPLKLKVEINTREHFAVYGFRHQPFVVSSRWFEGSSEINTYVLEELLATKLRALYQRRKGRDLVDLFVALEKATLNPNCIITAFSQYMLDSGHNVTRSKFERNLEEKLNDVRFNADISPLLTAGFVWDINVAAEYVRSRLIALLPDRPRK